MELFDNRRPVMKRRYRPVTNAVSPEHYTDDFSSDRGYFTEENGTSVWSIENGMLSCPALEDGALTYLHIFEKNVTMKLRFRYRAASDNGVLSFLLRYNSPEAYVKLKYIIGQKMWGIYASHGADFPPIKYCENYTHAIEPDTWHELIYTVDASCASAVIDGEELFNVTDIDHLSPGRIAIGSQGAALDADSVDIAFLSGIGTLVGGLVHSKLPDNKYREGGSVFEMTDGSLTYEHGCGDTFTSCDNGRTWQKSDEPWTNTHGYPNILRLRNGDFIKIATRKIDGQTYKYSETSSDDGKTWTPGGNICKTPYESELGKTTAWAVNMNDKVTQLKSGRIFYGQNFDCQSSRNIAYGKYWVFCAFYYSDDNGATWHKSETASYELGGNEDKAYFGECKILDCDDGTLRMYNSWNTYGCIVYSESRDNGVTWGPIVKMPEFICARSSMQFWRDPYADNDTTYYMVWVYSEPISETDPMSRSRLSMARSTDGKTWKFLCDIWRWESPYCRGADICHAVDAFVKTTKDYVICGAGYSEQLEIAEANDHPYHHAQRQHIYSIRKDALTPRDELPPV